MYTQDRKFFADEHEYTFMPEIYDRFKEEYNASDLLYRSFIESKNLGLLTAITNENERIYKSEIRSDYYKVIDKQKYMLAKIKYGI
jgi:hypothetical protein